MIDIRQHSLLFLQYELTFVLLYIQFCQLLPPPINSVGVSKRRLISGENSRSLEVEQLLKTLTARLILSTIILVHPARPYLYCNISILPQHSVDYHNRCISDSHDHQTLLSRIVLTCPIPLISIIPFKKM